MAFHRSIRSRRARKSINKQFELPLTSMMDVLVIIVVFLLKSYATSTNSLATVPGIKLPISASMDSPTDSLQLIITPEAMTFESERILDFIQTAAGAGDTDATYSFKRSDLDEGGMRIVPLFDALTKAKEKSELLRARYAPKDVKPKPFDGILAIQADKRVQYDTIRRIMYTAAAAGYKVFRFIAMKRET
ncbi:MAG: ExbD/TolR family protein [Bdellovibrionota bacterium]